jgi:3-methyladenine DNA glycosylase AlkC
MAEPMKRLLGPPVIEAGARHLARAAPEFPARAFLARVVPTLESLELKARVALVADALEATLPPAFPRAAAVIERALAPLGDAPEGAPTTGRHADGLSGWFLWPVGEFVARRGLEHPSRALEVLHALTQRFTAEFAIRPFVAAHPSLVFQTLATWVHDPSPHVRRLVSEGTRPRLPWGTQLRALIADPSPALPLLEALLDDPSASVRRSVANHLNDIARDHPALVTAWVEERLPGASAARRALLRHASRTLIKRGDRRMLAAWDLGTPFRGTVSLAVAPGRIRLGAAITLTITLRSTGRTAQRVAVDYRVHHVGADGGVRPKVFKGFTADVPAHGTVVRAKRHAVRPITTRRYYAGRHLVDIQANGVVVADAAFVLQLPAAGPARPRRAGRARG